MFFFPGLGGSRLPPRKTESKLYEVLGLTRDASDDEIRLAYKRLRARHHPDRGGDSTLFHEVQNAFEVLSDPVKKKVYDQFGQSGVEDEGLVDLIRSQEAQREEEAKGPSTEDIVDALPVTLEDLYRGKTVKFQYQRVVFTDRQTRTVATESAEAVVEPGMKNGDKIVLEGRSHVYPGARSGDVVLVVRQVRNERFEREGDDLVVSADITLADALCGARVQIEHLDGSTVVVDSYHGDVIAPDSTRAVPGLGMPVRGSRSGDRGRLIIRFNVKFPLASELTPAKIRAIGEVLGHVAPEARPLPEGAVHKQCIEFADSERDKGATEEDDDEHPGMGGGPRVQCAQQ